jgi:hypothetical protein
MRKPLGKDLRRFARSRLVAGRTMPPGPEYPLLSC